MNIYRSPLYPALMIRLPGDGRRNVKASGGIFNVAERDVEDFEAIIAKRPHYKIELVSTANAEPATDSSLEVTEETADTVVQPEPMSESELEPEKVTVESLEALNVPVLRERLQGLGLPDDGRKAVLVKRLADAMDLDAADADDGTNDSDADDTNE